nr:class I SAM-dependent methyltransferase [Cohnella zeiphila]
MNWNDRTAVHAKSAFYGMDDFLAGKNSLSELELSEVGDVSGRSLLHLQCHFGMDSLSWARLGARVTGVDFSDRAIGLAESLNERLGLGARFLCSDLYNAREALQGELFDIVYTSYGVLCWLPDLTRWAELIGASLKPGGTFYMAEMHPITFMYEAADGRLALGDSYFDKEAHCYQSATTYTGDGEELAHPVSYQWQHTLGEIVSALAGAGLTLEFLHEFPFAVYHQFPGLMVQDDRGRWRMKDGDRMPLLFSVKATKR